MGDAELNKLRTFKFPFRIEYNEEINSSVIVHSYRK